MRLGVDLGGSKIEILALGDMGEALLRRRIATPKDYQTLLARLADLVHAADTELGMRANIGIAIPGTESLESGLIKNANTTYLIAKPLRVDLERVLERPVRLANDANCFALSEACDGAAAGHRVVFGIIAGTGVGGGIVVDGKILTGPHGVAGEWGHIPLPSANLKELEEASNCYCGRRGCVETWCSGPALVADFLRHFPAKDREAGTWNGQTIAQSALPAAIAAMDRLIDRMARALACVVNILDPDVIVLGGGLSNIERLYRELPACVERYAFTLGKPPRIVRNKHGDSSGVRGAAWLWPEASLERPRAVGRKGLV